MKLHFEDNLDYQLAAIESVANLFQGQEICRTEFTVSKTYTHGMVESDLGIGNRLQLLDDELQENLKDIQLKNGLSPSGSLNSGDFTVEMETGTGKNLCLPANHLRAEQTLRVHQVSYRRPIRCHQRRCVQDPSDNTRPL